MVREINFYKMKIYIFFTYEYISKHFKDVENPQKYPWNAIKTFNCRDANDY